jgi:hypothetical protein
MVAGAGPGRSERASSGFVVPYSPEYLRFRSSPVALREIARRTGGRMLSGKPDEEIFVKDRVRRASSKPVIDWFLIALACLVPLDVGVRRIQLDWLVVRGWFVRESKRESEKTLGALLERKKSIEQERKEEKARRPVVVAPRREAPAVPAPDVGARHAVPDEPEKPEQLPADTSTTGRLRELKKKWKGEQKP